MITALVPVLIPMDVPVGWSPNPEDVDVLRAVLLLGGVPLLLFVAIALAVYIPSLVRGESLAPGGPVVENQWLGGPRTSPAQLTGPGAEETDPADPDTGGASGRW